MNCRQTIEQLRSQQETIVGYLRDLIAARTENPPGDEYRAAEVLRRFFDATGIPCETFEKAEGRTNIIGRVGSAAGGGPRVAVVCHLDTVPAGDGWTTDPFEATLIDGRLYGRGAKDDKGPTASAMAAMAWLKEHEDDLGGEILLIGAADEERGSEYGTVFLLASDACGKLDAALVPDAGNNMANIDIAEKGVVFLRIICHGRQAHGSRPDSGVNAIYPMAELVSWFRRWRMPGDTNDLFLPETPTRNVGMITGGAAANMVPARCEMQVDMRYLPGTDEDELLAEISNVIDRLEKKFPGVVFEMEILMGDVPTAVGDDAPVVEALQWAVEEVTGRRPRLFGISGATVAKQFIAAGVPAIGICPGDPDTAHVADEYVPVSEIVDFAAVLALCLYRMMEKTS
jgi:succinyl-diaminopimelate desuccinylase